MQVRDDLSPVGFTHLPEREVALRLGGHGIINQLDWPNAKAIKNFLRHTLIADIAHTRLAAQEGAVPFKLGFRIDSYDEYRWPVCKPCQLPLSRAKKPYFRRARRDLGLLPSFRSKAQPFNIFHLASMAALDTSSERWIHAHNCREASYSANGPKVKYLHQYDNRGHLRSVV